MKKRSCYFITYLFICFLSSSNFSIQAADDGLSILSSHSLSVPLRQKKAHLMGYETAFVELIARIDALALNRKPADPIFIVFYGTINAGKTYIIRALKDYYRENSRQITVVGHAGGASVDMVKDIPRIEKEMLERADPSEPFPIQVYLFHMRTRDQAIVNDQVLFFVDDPNFLVTQIGKRIDLNVAIYNPAFEPQIPEGNFDLIVSNVYSQDKYAVRPSHSIRADCNQRLQGTKKPKVGKIALRKIPKVE